MLNIIYSCNKKLFDGLYLSILSILRRTKSNINFYVLTGDLKQISNNYEAISTDQQNLLLNLIKEFNVNSTLTVLNCSKKYIEQFGETFDIYRFSPYTLFRLFIPEIEQLSGKALYLDVDTLINDDISQAFDIQTQDIEMVVCHDYAIQQSTNNENNKITFNAGVLLINIEEVRKTQYFKKAIEYIKTYNPEMADQQALNSCWTRIKTWKNEYRFNYQQSGIEQDTVIKHFVYAGMHLSDLFNIKPWDISKVQNVLNLHNWDEDYEYFIKQKKKWENLV